MTEDVLEFEPGPLDSGTLVGGRQEDDGRDDQRQDDHDHQERYQDAPPVALVRVARHELLKQARYS